MLLTYPFTSGHHDALDDIRLQDLSFDTAETAKANSKENKAPVAGTAPDHFRSKVLTLSELKCISTRFDESQGAKSTFKKSHLGAPNAFAQSTVCIEVLIRLGRKFRFQLHEFQSFDLLSTCIAA